MKGATVFTAHTVRSAAVGDIRDARTAGISPATAPMRMAEAMPPVHASAGMTTAPVLRGGIDGGCHCSGENANEAADESEQDRLGEELRPDLRLRCAEGAAETDL